MLKRPQDVEAEARSKDCDYFVFTVLTEVKDPGGLSPASVPKGVVLDPAKFQALTEITLYKVGKPAPEMKNLPVAADAAQFAVDAVTNTFVQESDKIAQQIAEDAHPKPASKTSKTPAKKSMGGSKPN